MRIEKHCHMCYSWEICEWLIGQFPWAFVIVYSLQSTVGFGIRKLCLRCSDIYNFPIWPLVTSPLFRDTFRVIFPPDTSHF